ncbi:MAG: hypothetical protein K8S23_01215 [Candidatus Cloacimonetes bacterium]|nr:hypothetical protein [Candidatus Cloacimonadota bacterium]
MKTNEKNIEDFDKDFLLMQYSSLRNEIIKRIEIKHQLISMLLIALGTFLAVGTKFSDIVLLIYPILSLFITIAWKQNDFRISKIGKYIKETIEHKFLQNNQINLLGWENYFSVANLKKSIIEKSVLPAKGIFIGSQIITLLIYFFKIKQHNIIYIGIKFNTYLFYFDLFIVVLTILILQKNKK